jgi:hypothetical protein
LSTDNTESINQKAIEDRMEERRKQFEEQRRGGNNKKRGEGEGEGEEENKTEQEQEQGQQTTLVPKLKPASDDEDKGVIFDKKRYPGISEAEYQRYWDTIGAQRSAYLTQIAKQSTFIIPLYTQQNEILDDPDKDLTEEDSAEISIEQKEFRFHDVTTSQWEVIQELDYDITQARQLTIQRVKDAPKGGLSKQDMDTIKDELREKERKKYRYAAKIFFRMTGSQIDRADQRRLKDAVDAAIHRTITTIPNSAKTSNQPFM